MTGQDDAGRAIFDPRVMALRGRIGGYATSSRHDPGTRPPRLARVRASFERKVDPEGVLAPEERVRRAEAARQAHYHKLAYLAAKKRREKRRPVGQDRSDAIGGGRWVRPTLLVTLRQTMGRATLLRGIAPVLGRTDRVPPRGNQHRADETQRETASPRRSRTR